MNCQLKKHCSKKIDQIRRIHQTEVNSFTNNILRHIRIKAEVIRFKRLQTLRNSSMWGMCYRLFARYIQAVLPSLPLLLNVNFKRRSEAWHSFVYKRNANILPL
ncbi:hypothetical protein Tcan_00074 [Toxocara canis]|uniref:Uncharacterized protein n=1 Tax=Toxocara canis TaxID=6265 RepID=A0A0B2V338_TOXCA|nr:hypothetical protein Tcan_00074 [Toxocara canis]